MQLFFHPFQKLKGCRQKKYYDSTVLGSNRQVTLSYLLNTSTTVHQTGPSALKKISALVKNKDPKHETKINSPPPLLPQRTSHPVEKFL